jgi:hypothetical protein
MIVTELILRMRPDSHGIRRSLAAEEFFVMNLFQPLVRSPLSDNFHKSVLYGPSLLY